MSILEKFNLNIEDYEHIQIQTPQDFNALTARINGSSEQDYGTSKLYVTLENDIDFAGTTVTFWKGFCGVIDGQNFKLKNINFNNRSESRTALFGTLEYAIVGNLTIESATYSIGTNSAIFAYNTKYSILFNCHVVNAKINQTYYSGTSDMSLFTVSGNLSYFNQCSVVGSSLKSEKYASGFISSILSGCTFVDCCVVNTTLTSTYTGDYNYVSGFYGCSYSNNSNETFVNCYTSVSISAYDKTQTSSTSALCLDSGNHDLVNCYYDSELSEITYETGSVALTTNDFKINYKEKLVGFDFDNVWKIHETNGYPVPKGVMPEVVDNTQKVEVASTEATVHVEEKASYCTATLSCPLFNTGIEGENWGLENGVYTLKHHDIISSSTGFYADFSLEESKCISFELSTYVINQACRLIVTIYDDLNQEVYSRSYSGNHYSTFAHILDAGTYRLQVNYSSGYDFDPEKELVAVYNFKNFTINATNGHFEYKIDEGEWKKSFIPYVGTIPSGEHRITVRFVSGENKSPEYAQAYNHVPVEYAGGDGTEGNPYLISTVEQLTLLQEQVNDLKLNTKDQFYQLTNDLDLSGINWIPIGILPGAYSGTAKSFCFFSGTFDGNHHTIHNLTINRSDEMSLGLFGALGDNNYHGNANLNPVIKNVTLKDVSIVGNESIAPLVGYTYFYREYDKEGPSRITIDNCHVRNANIIGAGYIGGIIGRACYSHTCSNCTVYNTTIDFNQDYSDRYEKGVKYAGGLIGYVDSGYGIQVGLHENNHVSKLRIKQGWTYLGGFSGMHYNSATINCSAESIIESKKGASGNYGGFCGYAYSSSYLDSSDKVVREFKGCSCKMSMIMEDPSAYISNIGGFTGYCSDFQFSDCRIIADIYGQSSTGGITGYLSTYSSNPNFTNILVSCRITDKKGTSSEVSPLFGISASSDSNTNVTNVYYDTDVCKIAPRSIGTPLKTKQMKGVAAKQYMGLDFESKWCLVDGDYPRLKHTVENSPFDDFKAFKGWKCVGQQKEQELLEQANELVMTKTHADLQTSNKTILGALNEILVMIQPQ